MTTKRLFKLLDAVTINETSVILDVGNGRRTISAKISGTGVVSCTITWYGSHINVASGGILLATSTLSGTTTDTTGADIPAEWPYMYCVLSGISGTNAAVTATVGV